MYTVDVYFASAGKLIDLTLQKQMALANAMTINIK